MIIMVTILKPLTLHHQFLHQQIKSLILFHPLNSLSKKGEYDIWAMKIKHYLSHTDYPIWQVIQNGNGPVSFTTYTNGMIKVLPSKTAKEVVAREKERKARTTLLMALPEDHLEKFHKMNDAKEMWEAIKSRFGGNDESKKIQKYLLKQQFEGFYVSSLEGLHKGYYRFQTLLGQLEIHGAGVSHEDANQKFPRSLPSSWSQMALIMRTKPGLDILSFDDLYNNLRVFKRDVKGTTASSLTIQNMAFMSTDNTSSTNDVSTAYIVSSPSVLKSQKEGSSSYIDEVAIISMRIKKFYKRTETAKLKGTKTAEKEMLGTMETKLETMVEDLHIRMTQNIWLPLMERILICLDMLRKMLKTMLSNLGFDNEVKSCSKACEESYARLKKLYDEQRDKLGDASVEITAYTLPLEMVEAWLLCHQPNQLAYEQKIRFMKIDLDDKTDVLAYHKKLLAEALKEKEDLKTKFENWQNSFKNLSRVLNTQMSANDKFRLGYGDYRYGSILSYENEVLQSVFMNKASDLEDTSINDIYADGMHAVPPPMAGNYMLSGSDVEIDYSKFTYGPKQTSADELDSKPSKYVSCKSDSSVETSTSMPEPVDNASKVDDPHRALKDKGIVNSGYSRHMTGNKAHLANYQEFKGGFIAFGEEIQANKSVGLKEANNSAGRQANDDQGVRLKEVDIHEEHFVLPIWSAYSTTVKSSGDKIEKNTNFKTFEKPVNQGFAAVLAILKLERLKANRARMYKEASKVESCPSEIILDDLLALDSIVCFDFK
nr:ribonuclease H-like domain-containing protein [Tanacetum cinerariifolium]